MQESVCYASCLFGYLVFFLSAVLGDGNTGNPDSWGREICRCWQPQGGTSIAAPAQQFFDPDPPNLDVLPCNCLLFVACEQFHLRPSGPLPSQKCRNQSNSGIKIIIPEPSALLASGAENLKHRQQLSRINLKCGDQYMLTHAIGGEV